MDCKRLSRYRNPWCTEAEASGTGRSSRARTPRSNASAALAMPKSEESSALQNIDTDQKQKLNLIESKEIDLANKLRSLYNQYGRAKKGTLKKESDILLKLSRVYLEKSKGSSSKDQKFNYIRCGTLLMAAIVRYKILGSQDKEPREAKKLCCELSKELLRSCGSKSTENLFDISSNIHKKVTIMRDHIESFIKKNLYRPEETLGSNSPEWVQEIRNLPENELPAESEIKKILFPGTNKVEQRITRNMKELNKMTTSYYKEIMCEIADECLNMLDSQRCKFSVVGLGSLAREEITMYSDFEHVIILDDEVNSNENYQNILEYFRWFSVLFYTVVIGLGETIIPSVQVKSLNDAFSEDSSKKWFYDGTTPNGIAFDGMLPHACKTPLGIPPTEKHPYGLELIKTPKDMARYLTSDNGYHLDDNGYHLDDILKCTCLVYGDKKTYDCFVENCKDNFEGGTEYAKKYTEKIEHNSNHFVYNVTLNARDIEAFDIKDTFYRPLATVLGFLGTIHEIAFHSTFEAIDELRRINAINESLYHSLSYAFAVACELRVKLYASVKQQRHQTDVSELLEIVGENGYRACKDMILYLGDPRLVEANMKAIRTGNTTNLADFNEQITAPSIMNLAISLSNRRYCEKALGLLKKNQDHQYESTLFYIYFQLGNQSNHVELHLKKAEISYKKLLEWKNMPIEKRMQTHHMMADIHQRLQQYPESMLVFQEYFALSRDLSKLPYTYPSAFFSYYEIAVKSMEPAKAKNHLESFVQKYKLDTVQIHECEIIKRYFNVLIRLYEGDKLQNIQKKLQQDLESITNEIECHGGKLKQPRLLLLVVLRTQICLLCFSDVVKTIDSIDKLPKSYGSGEFRRIESNHLDLVKFICLCRLDRYTNAIERMKVEQLSQKEKEKYLLQVLITKVWRILQSSHFPSADELITILNGIIHLKLHQKLDYLFVKEKIPFIQNVKAKPYGTIIKISESESKSCMPLLLRCLTPLFWRYRTVAVQYVISRK